MSNAKNQNRLPRFVYVKLVADRAKELDGGQRPLVPAKGRSSVEIAIEEVARGKVTADVRGQQEAAPLPRQDPLFNHEGD